MGKAITDAGMDIAAISMFRLDRATAEEFFEVYKGVVNEYGDMVDELCTGSCFALEVHTDNAPAKVRNFCGPSDPDIARHLRPKTLRAMFGSDKMHNLKWSTFSKYSTARPLKESSPKKKTCKFQI